MTASQPTGPGAPNLSEGLEMVTTYNGMSAGDLGDIRWRKSQHSNPNGACVELAALPTGEIAMRNSRFPLGAVLLYTQAEITAFLAGAKEGEFDNLLTGTTNLPASSIPRPSPQAARQQRIGERDPRWPFWPATTREDQEFC
jgi:hypothetical protein